jgi:hypothetical protein
MHKMMVLNIFVGQLQAMKKSALNLMMVLFIRGIVMFMGISIFRKMPCHPK